MSPAACACALSPACPIFSYHSHLLLHRLHGNRSRFRPSILTLISILRKAIVALVQTTDAHLFPIADFAATLQGVVGGLRQRQRHVGHVPRDSRHPLPAQPAVGLTAALHPPGRHVRRPNFNFFPTNQKQPPSQSKIQQQVFDFFNQTFQSFSSYLIKIEVC